VDHHTLGIHHVKADMPILDLVFSPLEPSFWPEDWCWLGG